MKKARDNRTTEPLVKKKREQVEKSKKEEKEGGIIKGVITKIKTIIKKNEKAQQQKWKNKIKERKRIKGKAQQQNKKRQ